MEIHAADLSRVTKREEDLFDTELPTIQLCEEHLAVTSDEQKLVLPDWLERAGAPEAVEVGADLRYRFGQLKTGLVGRVDQATQLLASVLSFEANYDSFNEWLSGEVANVGSLSSPSLAVEEISEQLAQLEVCMQCNISTHKHMYICDVNDRRIDKICWMHSKKRSLVY